MKLHSKRVEWSYLLYFILIILISSYVYTLYVNRFTRRIERFADRRPLVIGFDETWDLFNKELNLFTLVCEHTGKYLSGGERKVIGVDVKKFSPGEEAIDIFMFFENGGERLKQLKPGIPKVHFTGEPQEKRVEGTTLSLGFNYDTNNYFRFPLWLFYINWFHQDIQKLKDIGPIAIDRCSKVFPEEIPTKNKFCSFIVTNGKQPVRNRAFETLSNYKYIESAGKYKNNVGNILPPKGESMEIGKVEYLKQFKFCIAYENIIQEGYTTEKFLHAKAAGCIPIYWGDPKLEHDFDINGCIDARNFTTDEELIDAVREIDTNDELYHQKFMVPLLDETRLGRARATLAECGKRLWSLVLSEDEVSTIPRQIGETSGS